MQKEKGRAIMTLGRCAALPMLAAAAMLHACAGGVSRAADTPAHAPGVRHSVVYAEDGRFAGWPANHGIWIWGDEILVGFSRGFYKDRGNSHHIDTEKPEDFLLARSLDGGETWAVEQPRPAGIFTGTARMRHGAMPEGTSDEQPTDLARPIDFTNPNLAFTVRMEDKDAGRSRFFYSYDRGKTWRGPYWLPLFGQKGVMARTDYIVSGPSDCTLLLTASKSNGLEGRPFTARTTDGGLTWKFVNYIGPEPEGYAIMPSTVRVGPKSLVTAIRRKDGGRSWIEAYVSHDLGAVWLPLSVAEPDAGEGNPGALVMLKDRRLALIYGHRAEPFGIRARINTGSKWTQPVILRDEASRDMGYARAVVRPDGKVVAVYYHHDPEHPTRREIAATIWDPAAP